MTHAIDQAQHLRWAYPVVEGAKLHFFMPKSIEHFTQNSWGIWEPHRDHSEEIPLTGLSGILVPALAFDLSGFRLGRGGGYYDRTLAEFTGFKIGLAFSEQIAAAELPHENFDIPMDAIVTEKAVINCLSKLERMKS